eukprot:TRINITY_DN5058_c0_g1_i1.p1 TRINITY_DN5058_c0_g1~~TRINITY_DN5058_c0_g1_i1.p1  ORF type:complete len:534 (+),score=148.46 TRINITY_DN5058_c0_g1_i1:291-1892(+)
MEFTTLLIIALVLIVCFVFRKTLLDAMIELSVSKYRWISAILFVLPLSKSFEIFQRIRNRWNWMNGASPQKHAARVARVQKQMKSCPPGQPMVTARPTYLNTSFFHAKYKSTMHKIDLNDFTDILEVDTKRKVVRCEPLVTCAQLTHTLTPLGWQMAVVPELDDLTVGGLIAGFGVEGSSFKHGLFQHICESFEMIMADGSVVHCSEKENPELFFTVPWSYGTLGFIASAEIKLVPFRKFIHLKYEPCFSQKQWIDLTTKYTKDTNIEYIETLCFSKDTAVVMTGIGVDSVPAGQEIEAIGNFYKPWFYEHVRAFLGKAQKKGGSEKNVVPFDEYIPAADYFHRHTKSLFWEVADIITFGNHPIFRYALGWLLPPKVSLFKLFTTERMFEEYKRHHVTQDMLVPISKLSQCIDTFHEHWRVYPLWICPCKHPHTPVRGLLNETSTGEEMFVDVGAYGVPHNPNFDAEKSHRAVEKFVREVEGYQTLYAATYMTKEEFEQMFDHSVYDKLRKKYGCDGRFPRIYDKVCRTTRGL